MCGIVGYVGEKNALDVIMQGLRNLEYRGYDSAGVALNCGIGNPGFTKRAVGKLSALEASLVGLRPNARSGIGHTRWATHGVPSLANAHPHRYGRVSLVHNGIIENHQVIREKLIEKGHQFQSHTDTEVAAHLMDRFLNEGLDPLTALSKLCDTLSGAYSFGILLDDDHERVYFAKNGSPMIVARGNDENFFASDQAALVEHQPNYYALKDLEIGYISGSAIEVFDLKGKRQNITWMPMSAKKEFVQKMGHKHFMHKEIFEQPETIHRVLSERLSDTGLKLSGFGLDFDQIAQAKKIQIVACGSAYYAGLIARPFIEATLKIPTEVEIASEFRYRESLTNSETLVIAISQSGETVDTLKAMEKALDCGAMGMSVCNVVGSAIASLCKTSVGNLFINAGPEISVASTKAFIGQLAALRLFTMAMAKVMARLPEAAELTLHHEFLNLVAKIKAVLDQDQKIRTIACELLNEPKMFFLGRGSLFPVALEGALKMKELSYIFAEGYPAGELKHGPIAIIDPGMPVIVLFSRDELSIKTASNLQEVKARGARVVGVGPRDCAQYLEPSDLFIELGECASMLEPILATIPLQLLAYHLSDQKNIDVDKPRNLAKSVTVE